MINVLGQFSVMLALALAAAGTLPAVTGIATTQPAWVRTARNSIYLVFILLTLAMGALEYAFLSHDFLSGSCLQVSEMIALNRYSR